MKPRAPSLVLAALLLSGCGVIESIFGDSSNGGGGDDTTTPPFGTFDAGADAPKPCTNLCLKQVQCGGGATTSLSGTVKDPAGKNPLYNILVYVPNAPVEPMKSGASCDRCGSVSGDPLVTALTDAAGHFKLENVPVTDDLPLVIQVGKWRRQITVPKVAQCADTPLADEDIRLPKNQKEGDIPKIALTTGGADVMECLLRKVGVEDAEFTTPTGTGRVNFYKGSPSNATGSFAAGGAFPSATTFWDQSANLMQYDMVILSCEGAVYSGTKPTTALDAMHDYANAGGRIFASHWHRYWFNTAAEGKPPQPSSFESFATWQDLVAPGDHYEDATGIVDDSFPKGKAMKDWLVNVGASTTPGQIPIKESKANVLKVDPAHATQWITMTDPYASNATVVEYLSFNAPIPAPEDQKCGRVVYSDLHVSSGDAVGQPWPNGCKSTDLSPQEKALEFMLFDLSSCVQSDQTAPSPPAVK
jgi:hypothetical protein